MPPLTWHVDVGRESTHVAVRGRPSGDSVSSLRQLLGELSDRMIHGTRVLVRRTGPRPAETVDGDHDLPARLSRDLAGASKVLADGPPQTPSVSEHLLPISGAARRARDIVTAACRSWSLAPIAGDAAQIASELVSHAIERSSTMMTVVATPHAGSIYVWVRAGGRPNPPGPALRPPGRCLELLVVAALARQWGYQPDGEDTLIWAALPVPSSPQASPPP